VLILSVSSVKIKYKGVNLQKILSGSQSGPFVRPVFYIILFS